MSFICKSINKFAKIFRGNTGTLGPGIKHFFRETFSRLNNNNKNGHIADNQIFKWFLSRSSGIKSMRLEKFNLRLWCQKGSKSSYELKIKIILLSGARISRSYVKYMCCIYTHSCSGVFFVITNVKYMMYSGLNNACILVMYQVLAI